MEEKPGVVPMFDTSVWISCAGISARTACSTCPTSRSVSSRRVPLAALRLMTNWPGSVRGKYALPMSGYAPNDRRNTPLMPHTVATGRSRARPSECV